MLSDLVKTEIPLKKMVKYCHSTFSTFRLHYEKFQILHTAAMMYL
jgi:hypothetical protein